LFELCECDEVVVAENCVEVLICVGCLVGEALFE
jgi:hypothetical protein